jgi:hypothetical protein
VIPTATDWLDFGLWLAVAAFLGWRRGRLIFARRFFEYTSAPEGLAHFSRAGDVGKALTPEMRIAFGLRYALGGALLAGLIIGPLIYFLRLRG